MSYPSAMKAMAARLSNYSSTIRRVDPLGRSDGYKAGQVTKFLFPANASQDWRTAKLHFTGSTTCSGSTAEGVVTFPNPIQGIIDQITVHFNGIQVEATPIQWGFLHKMIDDFSCGVEERKARQLLGNELLPGLGLEDEVFYAPALNSSDAVVNGSRLIPGHRETNRPFVIDSFPGCFLGTVQCPVLHSAMTGDIMVEIRWAPNSVLTAVGVRGEYSTHAQVTDPTALPSRNLAVTTSVADSGAAVTGAAYSLDAVYFTIKTIDISDGTFYSWLKSEVARAPLELTHQHWEMQPGTQQTSANNTTRMTLKSSSVDMLIGTFVPTDYDSGLLQPGQVNVAADATAGAASLDGTYANTHACRYFQRGCIDTSVGQSSMNPAGDFKSQWQINNVDVNYNEGMADVFAELKEEFNLGKSTTAALNPRIKNLSNFAKGFLAVPLRLNFKCSDTEKDTPRYLSGLDTRNATVNVLWRTKGTTDGNIAVTPQIWAQSTAIVRLGEGQRFDLVA